MTRKNTEQDFWAKVNISGPTNCWPWMASKIPDGYGNFSINGKIMLTHRLAWEFTFGPIPEGMNICHTCDNPPCCNPAHLFLGTQIDNIRDMIQKGHLVIAHHTGETNGTHKLTWEQVAEIRRLYLTGDYSQSTLGKMFGVCTNGISLITRNKIWRTL
jgi:hypothetical protein